MKEVRIDKWLWATRVFKTRTIATTACKLGRVTIGGMTVKPSHGIKVGDRIDVIVLLNNRVGAKLVPQYLKNITSEDQLRLLELVKIDGFVNRQRGMGRPTKKEGRELQDFTDDAFFGFDDPSPIDDSFDWDEDENPLWTEDDENRLNEEIARRNKEHNKG